VIGGQINFPDFRFTPGDGPGKSCARFRDTILRSLAERNLHSDELSSAVNKADTFTALEDIYQRSAPSAALARRSRKSRGWNRPLPSCSTINPRPIHGRKPQNWSARKKVSLTRTLLWLTLPTCRQERSLIAIVVSVGHQ
jgi:hypothetical protein